MDFFADWDDLTVEELDELIDSNLPQLQDVLVDALDHHHRAVRIHAALKLAELFHDVRAVPALAEAMRTGDRHIRKAAADVLWEIGDADTPGLIRALHFEHGPAREALVEALDLSGWFPDNVNSEIAFRILTWSWREIIAIGPPAVSGLVSALSDPDGNVRRGAAWTLGQIGDARAVPWLIKCLSDAEGGLMGINERVCDIAAEALLRIGTPEALEAVERWQSGGVE
jgi:HEAT repeat protein